MSVSSNVVRSRRATDASLIDEWALADTDADVVWLQMSRWSRMGAAIDRARNRLGFVSLTERRCRWQSLPHQDHTHVIDVLGSGVAVACETCTPAGELVRAIYACGVSSPLEVAHHLAALEAHASEFLVADATSPMRWELSRARVDAGGRLEIRAAGQLEAGEMYPLQLGLVDLGDGRFVTQVVEARGAPWIVVVTPGHSPERITRAWFDPKQAIVRDGVLFHFAGFGSRRLLRLELRAGATPTSVFGDGRHFRFVEALSPDASLALLSTDEAELVGTPEVARIYHLLDIATGRMLARLAIPFGERLSSWLVR